MDLSNLIHKEIPNKKWKRLFLAPDKVPVGTENEKAAVRKKLLTSLPFMEPCVLEENFSITTLSSCPIAVYNAFSKLLKFVKSVQKSTMREFV